MLQSIIAFSIKQKLITGLMVLGLVVIGIWQVTLLPIDAVPDITNNQVQVITQAPALGATDIERLVTFPVEQACSNIPGLIELRSFSRFGLSLVTLVFTDETDIYRARQQVSERLQEVKDQIPSGLAQSYLAPVTTGLGEIFQYTVRPAKGYEDTYSLTELRTIQDWIIRRSLLRVEGVADVSSFGGKLRQYEVSIHPDQLASRGMTLQDLIQALEANNQNTGGAYIEKAQDVFYIRTEGLLGSISDIENIPVRMGKDGISIPLKEVAKVKEGHAIRYGTMTYNGEQEVAGAVVMMVKGGNSSKTIRLVKDKVEEIQKILPEGIVLEPFLDRTKMVNNAIGTVAKNLGEGALIVVFVLVLFLGNIRAGLIVASVIPLSMLFAIIMMNLTGVSGNLMSLGALDFGLIVDGAVIIVEAVLHRMSHHPGIRKRLKLSGAEMDSMTTEASGRMMNSAVFGQIIILVVYLPIFTLKGIEGKMFQPMALTVAYALAGAFLLSLTWIPMISSVALPRRLKADGDFASRWMQYVEGWYLRGLKFALRRSAVVVIAVLILAGLSIPALLRLGGEFIPALEEGDFAVETRLMPGNSLSMSTQACLDAERLILANFPEVEQVVGKTGSSEIPVDPMPVEASDLMIILKDKSEWVSATTFPEMAEKMKTVLAQIPGINFGFQYPVQMRFNELMTGARQDVVCKIFGEDLDTLAYYAHALGHIISSTEGTADLYVESVTGMPELVIRFNRPAMAAYDADIEEVNDAIRLAYSGHTTGMVYEGEKRFDLVMRLPEDVRQNPETIGRLMIPLRNGQVVPLQALASVSMQEGPNQIQREDARRRIITGFNIRGGRDVQSVVHEIQDKVKDTLLLPPGYHIQYGGSFEHLEAAKARLFIAVPAALLMILLLLYFAFYSMRQALLIFSAVPLSAIGGIFALYLRDMPFSISAGVGFIALFGVAVLNGIVLMAEFNRRRLSPGNSLSHVLLNGGKTRLRPVLMTALVASLGFLPMALSNGAGAEVQKPLATVVIGGLLLATLITLFLLPILYAWAEKQSKGIKVKALTITLILVLPMLSFGQTALGVEEACSLALQQNRQYLKLKAEQEYISTASPAAGALPRLEIQAEYGQMNSIYSDRRMSITQSFEYPGVYSRQKELQSQEAAGIGILMQLEAKDVIRNIRTDYAAGYYLNQQKSVLLFNDSLLEISEGLAQVRFNAGETDVLELTTVRTQRELIRSRLDDIKIEILQIDHRLNLLINSEIKMQPKFEQPGSDLNTLPSVESHPHLKSVDQECKLSDLRIQLEKNRRMPGFSIGFAGMTMYGTGADNQLYSYSKTFQSLQAGLTLPLIGNRHSSLIQAEGIRKAYLKQELEFRKKSMFWEIETLQARKKSLDTTIQRLEGFVKNGLDQESKLLNLRLNKGEVSLLEWSLLMKQQLEVRLEYWSLQRKRAEIIEQLNWYHYSF